MDDVKVDREILKKILQDEYNIIEAAQGQEAVATMQCHSQDLSAVLLDLVMPVRDGFSVLECVRHDTKLKQIPIIVTTGDTEEISEVKALQLGANDYISKPYSPAIIRQRLRNVISLRETAATINELQKDRLTGLYSRSAFFDKAEAMIKEAEAGHYVIGCFDIDNFKIFNDLYGTKQGDDALRYIASVFQEGIEPMGGICSRIMADNFAILYPTSFLASQELAKITQKAAKLYGSLRPLSFCIGRYVVDDTSLSVSAMYDRAVIASNSVKGRVDVNIAFFDESMRDKLLVEQRVVGEMKSALKDGQFEPWFQPQYNHATGELIGAEVLVRWRHPVRGMIPLGDFIPIFEKNGFIYEMDRYIWEQTCICLHRWLEEGRKPLPVSVNISRCDVFRDELVSDLIGLIHKYELPTELLRLEITESAFSQGTDQIIKVVKQLVGLGFTVEIDDFGSGYSSLNTIKDVPAQIIKLDMKFLCKTKASQRSGNIIESMVRMAKWLNMTVIAEGVETIKQADFLKSIGCYYIQGYLYAKPMCLQDYEALAACSTKQCKVESLETVENLDNNAFWNPNSIDTLISNSYLGGACVYEYTEGRLELIRANDKYIKVLGSAGMNLENALKLNWFEFLDAESSKKMVAIIQEASTTSSECTEEFVFINLPGCQAKTYLRLTLRVIAKSGTRYLIYCTNENITKQRLAEQKREEATEQLRFLEGVAHDLLSQPDVQAGIDAMLQQLLVFFSASRVRIFEFDTERDAIHNTYALGLDGTKIIEIPPQMTFDWRASYWKQAFGRQKCVMIPAVEALAATALEKNMLQSQNIGALVGIPLQRGGQIIGFVMVEEPQQKLEQVFKLVTLGDYVVVMLDRRDMNEEIITENQEKLAVMDGIPGGFVRMQIKNDGVLVPLYHSEGFQRLVAMNQDELLALEGEDVLKGVWPEDVPLARHALDTMLQHGEVSGAKFRLYHGDGGYVWVLFFGKIRRSRTGELYLNAFYSDATEQKNRESVQIELLDNLPCAVALFEYDKGELAPINLNKHYWTLVKRSPIKDTTNSVLSFVYPEDRKVISEKIALAIEQKGDINCIARIMCGDDKYRTFQIMAKVLPQANGKYTLCAAYVSVDAEKERLQELLPVILSSIMGATSNISFIKDEQYRYLGCSKEFAKLAGLKHVQEVFGKTDYDFFPKKLADKYRRDDERIFHSKKAIIDMLEDLPSKDGYPRFSNTSKYPMYDDKGQILGLYGVGRDITALRETSNWFNLISDNIACGVATFACSDKQLTMLHCNNSLCKICGLSQEECHKSCYNEPFNIAVAEDRAELKAHFYRLWQGADSSECIFRMVDEKQQEKWINMKATVAQRQESMVLVNAVFLDVTTQQKILEQLRLSEEEYRVAMKHTGNLIGRFSVADRTLSMSPEVAEARGVPQVIRNMPQGMIELGLIPKESQPTYIDFYTKILRGAKTGSTVFQYVFHDKLRWTEAFFSTIFSNGKPVFAIISYVDVTERLEKEMVYNKWKQSIQERAASDYTLFRCNLSRDSSCDIREGDLLPVQQDKSLHSFNEVAQAYATKYVVSEDRAAYLALLDSNYLHACYYQGERQKGLEYRELLPTGGFRWLHVSIELVEYPNSSDVEAYMLFENIDEAKREALKIKAQAENDQLTGLLNRATFALRMNNLLAQRQADKYCALLILDLDDFKLLNDTYGHVAGDEALIEVGRRLHTSLRLGDLVGRLGGDEFIVCLNNMPDKEAVASKANRLCDMLRQPYANDAQMSASIGIAVAPEDGNDFATLYLKADDALYSSKRSGKKKEAFYDAGQDK